MRLVAGYPTRELSTLTVNETPVRCRIWRVTTDKGTEVEFYVLGMVPVDKTAEGIARLNEEVPDFFRPSRDLNIFKLKPKD